MKAFVSYRKAKEVAGDALLLFRNGEFYELFEDDARIAANILGLTITTKIGAGQNECEGLAMVGFPHHQLEAYLAKIVACGKRAAVCEIDEASVSMDTKNA